MRDQRVSRKNLPAGMVKGGRDNEICREQKPDRARYRSDHSRVYRQSGGKRIHRAVCRRRKCDRQDQSRIPRRAGYKRISDRASSVCQIGGVLPDTISREQYAAIRADKSAFPAWMVGAAGFLASYNGKFFGGYAGRVNTKQGERDYYDEARRNLQKQAAAFQTVDFARFDYRNVSFNDCVIYCDPPYFGTTGYNGEVFDTAEFWNIIRAWSERNVVLVSEETAPPDFKCIWSGDVKRTQDNASRKTATEKLFIFERGYST